MPWQSNKTVIPRHDNLKVTSRGIQEGKKMKNQSIISVAARLLNTPLLIHSGSLNTVLGIMSGHTGLDISIGGKQTALSPSLAGRPPVSQQNGISVIPVTGILANKQDEFMEWLFGDTSYETIRTQFQAALADPNVKSIVFIYDTPGGEVSGCFDLVDEIYNARGIKPIYAIVNEMAYSAGYALASAAEKIFIPRTGGAGSVGVICVHMDQSKLDETIGVKYTPIFAGSHKNDFDSHAPLSSEAQKAAQEETNRIYELFVKTVARNRGIAPQAVRDTEAGIYYGKNAVDAGLADTVAPWSKAMNDIANKKTSKGGSMKALTDTLREALQNAPADKVAAAMAELGYAPKPQAGSIIITQANLDAIATGIGVKVEQLTGDIKNIDFAAIRTGIKEEAKKEATARVTQIMEMCTLAGLEKMALGYVSKEDSIEDIRKQIIEAQAADAQNKNIRSTVRALSTGEVNPLIADAQKRAEAVKK